MQKKRGVRGGKGWWKVAAREPPRRLPISPSLSPFHPPLFCRPPMRFSNKVENTDRRCSPSFHVLYIPGPRHAFVVGANRPSTTPRLASPRLATPIIISLERAASLRRLYRNGVDVCFVCTSPSGVLQRVGISKQEVGTFVITRDRVPAERETAESPSEKISVQFPLFSKNRPPGETRSPIAGPSIPDRAEFGQVCQLLGRGSGLFVYSHPSARTKINMAGRERRDGGRGPTLDSRFVFSSAPSVAGKPDYQI